ncbi:MAG: Golgi apparatus membrane protein tvp18 [Chaenotheca gracillima]|nr:MAG: Golgi apparatus membrane protein tvp18 [Chaenotheca gracillima]
MFIRDVNPLFLPQNLPPAQFQWDKPVLVQRSQASGGFLIQVTGAYMFETERPLSFVHTFHLVQVPNSTEYYIQNEFFKVVFGMS